MAVTLAKLEKYFVVEKLIFHSIDLSLYHCLLYTSDAADE